MPKLNWNGDDFRNPQDSSGTVADTISRDGSLQQGYSHGSLTKGLVAYYPMDSGSGSTLVDSTPSSMNGDIQSGGTVWSENSRVGDFCLDLNGSDEYVTVPTFEIKPWNSAITISVWIKADSLSKEQNTVFGQYDDATDSYTRNYLAVDDEGNEVFWDQWPPGGNSLNSSSISLDTWYHVVIIQKGSYRAIYLDGNLDVSDNNAETYDGDPVTDTRIGSRLGKNYEFDGKIDDLRIYERKLSEPEIKALYNLSRPSKISPGDTLQ